MSVSVDYDVDNLNERIVITTTTETKGGHIMSSATYITFEDLQDPEKVGQFFTKWGNKWLS